MFKSKYKKNKEAHEATGFDPYDGLDTDDLSSTHRDWPFHYTEGGTVHRKTANCINFGHGDASTKGVRRMLRDTNKDYRLCGNCCRGFVIDSERGIVFTGSGRSLIL